MPGPPRDRGQKLIDAVNAGEVTADKVRERVLNVLRLIDRTGAIDDERPYEELADDRPAHRALIRRAGAEGMVLLKNDGLLPLDAATLGKIAVIGPNAKTAQIMGGGSAQLNPHYAVSPWEGLAAAFGEDRLTYAIGCYQPSLRAEARPAVRRRVLQLRRPLGRGRSIAASSIGGEIFLFGQVAPGITDPNVWSARYTHRFRASLHR